VPLAIVNLSVDQTGFSQLTSMVPTVDNVNFIDNLTNPFPNVFFRPPAPPEDFRRLGQRGHRV
jgi:hypothetical protein